MLKTYRYKLEPNKAQRYALARTLDVCRELYNMGLEQRKMHRVSKFEQSKELPDLKDGFPIYHNVYGQVLQNALGRLDKAFQNFFRRCKEGGKPGFPRFKSENRYDSFTYPQLGFKLAGSHL
jgi:putative transposase